MIEVIYFSETPVIIRATGKYIPEDGIVHSHRYENLKSFIHYKEVLQYVTWVKQMKYVYKFLRFPGGDYSVCRLWHQIVL
jgi:hypothetical protein